MSSGGWDSLMRKGLFGSVPDYYKEENYRMSCQGVHDCPEIDRWTLVRLEKTSRSGNIFCTIVFMM